MELLGIGPLELLAALVVALLVLGPARMVEVTRTAGKFLVEARRALRELADEATLGLGLDPTDDASSTRALPEPRASVGRDGGRPERRATARRRGRTQASQGRAGRPRKASNRE